MNTCPYCREAVQDGAIKCPHCQSMLVPDQASKESDDRQVVYVVDRGLIRFGKFAAAVLAIFIVFGVYVFGFDLNELVRKMAQTEDKIASVTAAMDEARTRMEGAQRDLDTTRTEISDARAEINAGRQEVQGIRDVVQALLSEAQQEVAAIRSQRKHVDLMVVEYRSSLSGSSELRVKTVNVEEADSARTRVLNPRNRGKLWPVGSVLRVKFIDPEPSAEAVVRAIAAEWSRHANVGFEFVESWSEAEIRLTFKNPGFWSYVGTDALNIPQDQPTMNLGIRTSGLHSGDASAYIFRQFGHTLGLLNEHQNPKAPFEWDREEVRRSYANVDESLLEQMFFSKWPADSYPIDKPFDRRSIMMISVDQSWTRDDFSTGLTTQLSQMDKDFLAQLYPRK